MSSRIHVTPGRIRVRLNEFSSALPENLMSELVNLPGVESVLHTAASGSLLIHFHRDLDLQRSLFRILQRYGYLQNVVPFRARPQTAPVRSPAVLPWFGVLQQILSKAVRLP